MLQPELKDCPSFPGRQVTANGEVWSTLKNTWVRSYVEGGYLATKYRNRKVYVHQLVADAFIGPCPPDHEVNHLDMNKGNNEPWNLEYTTHQANSAHSVRARGYDTKPRVMGTRLPRELCDPESPRLRRMHAYLRGALTPPAW